MSRSPLPPPFAEAGRYLGKPDLRDLDHFLSIGYEGDEHRTDPRRFRRDIARRERVARRLSVTARVEWSGTVPRTASGSTS